MARRPSRHPTELELEILKVLWQGGAAGIGEVRNALARFRDLAYTTVTTIMNIMVDKRYLSRKKVGPSYVYRPRVTRKAVSRRMLSDLVNRLFEGSASAVMMHLIEPAELDEGEIAELRKLLDRKSREIRP